MQTIKINEDNRHEVHLQLAENTPPFPGNLCLDKKMLINVTNKLLANNFYQGYEKRFFWGGLMLNLL